MSWRSVKFDWNRARAFLVTAEEGSLMAAARALKMSQPTLGRQVTALEEELGVALFERSGRGLELTPNGLELLEHVRSMGEAASKFSLAATGHSEKLIGQVTITGSEVTTAFVLVPIIKKFRELEPGIRIELIASNETADLKRREADIAVRGYRPTQPDLICKKIRDGVARFYATPSYLKSLGDPTNPDQFADASFIAFTQSGEYLQGLQSLGLPVSNDNFHISTENHLVHWECVKHGMGIGVMPEEVGDAEDGLVRVLPETGYFPFELWLTAHRELKTSRKIRRVFDFLDEQLKAF